jgi:hypothetical protein
MFELKDFKTFGGNQMGKSTAVILLALFLTVHASASWKVGVLKTPQGTKVVSVRRSNIKVRAEQHVLLQNFPEILAEDLPAPKRIFQEFLVDDSALTSEMKAIAVRQMQLRTEDDSVRTLINQGPVENRISLTIVGDGYTQNDREKFFADAKSTTEQLFAQKAYTSYLPLFNVYAVFVASNESGIGDGEPKDTALSLYRFPKGSKRGIMPGNEAAAEEALQRAPGADFPILLANDNYYGGLGGRYAISTSSKKSGIIVLRHELGHNFGGVGEEYDGGEVYVGANYSPSTDVSWKQWVEGDFKVNEAINLGGEYIWQNLNGHPFDFNFNFPGGDYLFNMQLSTVGWETPNDVDSYIDNSKLKLTGPFNEDRHFYEVGPAPGLSAGAHKLHVEEQIHDQDNVLAFARLYAMPKDYDFTKNKVGAYLSYNSSGEKVGYRPTHDSCPMRDMLNPEFCVVDKENMWTRFLNRVSLIDGVDVGSDRTVSVRTPKLGPGLTIAWYKNDGGKAVEMPELRNLATWKADSSRHGQFSVHVQFATPEVRKYSNRFGTDKGFNL